MIIIMDLSNTLKVSKDQLINLKHFLNKQHNQKEEPLILSFGKKNFDEILAGGFYEGKKYLIFGANKTGKTQICHQICVQAYKKIIENSTSKTLINPKFTYYFDTENTFRPERIRDLTNDPKISYKIILKNIIISRIMSDSAFLLSLKNLEKSLDKEESGVLVIDSINSHFRVEQGDKNVSYKKSKELFLKILKQINYLTKRYSLTTIATAQISSNLLGNTIIQELPVGNQFLNMIFSEYLYLKYYKDGVCTIQNVNSSFLPEKKFLYKITPTGIKDSKFQN